MNILALFSGAGGLTEGFRNKPFDIIVHIEKDNKACLTMQTREVYHYLNKKGKLEIYKEYLKGKISRKELYSQVPDDILESVLNMEINQENLENIFSYVDNKLGNKSIDGIIGGPPCQAYSTIGRARNKDKKESDERIYLYKHYADFLKKYQPSFFIFENVKGLYSFKDFHGKKLFPQIIDEFKKAGYEVEHSLINASDYGVSQNRERVFIYGVRLTQLNKNLFFELLGNEKEAPDSVNQLFNDLPSLNAGSENNKYTDKSPSRITKKYLRNFKLPLSYHISRPNNKNDLQIYKIVSEEKKKGNNIRYYDLPKNLQTHKNKKSFVDRYKAIDGNQVSHTVVAHISKDGHYYIHPDSNQNRSLSVREAARIQGFPDSYWFETCRTDAFKQIGNAVPPILSRKLANVVTNYFRK